MSSSKQKVVNQPQKNEKTKQNKTKTYKQSKTKQNEIRREQSNILRSLVYIDLTVQRTRRNLLLISALYN